MQTAYTSHFGFSEKPFKFKPEPQFFFHNPNYDNAYKAVVKGLRERKSWVVLTGESGTGKTTLLHKCKTVLGVNFRIIPVPNTLPSINSILSHIGNSLNLDISDDISKADYPGITDSDTHRRCAKPSRWHFGRYAGFAQNLRHPEISTANHNARFTRIGRKAPELGLASGRQHLLPS